MVKKMTINISLLQMNGKPKTVKEGIVSLLINGEQLTAKQVFHKLQKQFGISVSYQAVYKTLNLLLEEEIVKKNEKLYLLNPDWVKKTKEFSEKLQNSVSTKKIDKENPIGNFELHTVHESDMFLLDFILDRLPQKRETMAWQWSHYWIPLFLSVEKYQRIQILQEKFEVYSTVKGNSLVDKWCSEFWNKQGAKTTFGANYGNGTDTVAFGDFVIQMHYPAKTLKKMDKFFNKIKKIEDININHLFNNIFLEKTKIIMTVNKNKELAERIKEETIKIIQEGRK